MTTVAIIGLGGIGSVLRQYFLENGHSVAVGRHRQDAPAAGASGSGSADFVVDVVDLQSCRQFFADARKAVGKIDAVVNCSGTSRYGPVILEDGDAAMEMFRTNVGGVINVSRVAASTFMKAGGGSIVNFSSIAAQTAIPGLAVYGASKAAVISFTRSFAMELASWKIRANVVAPGFVDAGMTTRQPTAMLGAFEKHIPLGRLSGVSEIAALVGYLVSDAARTVTGQTFVVDGGISLGSASLGREIAELAAKRDVHG